jgi:hypothetical protein
MGAAGAGPPHRRVEMNEAYIGGGSPAPAPTPDGNQSAGGGCGAGRGTPSWSNSPATDSRCVGCDLDDIRSGRHRSAQPRPYERLFGLRRDGYRHRATFLEGQTRSPSQLMPHVHQVVSLLKRWLLGTHLGSVTHITTTTSTSSRFASTGVGRAVAGSRLVQQAVAIAPAPCQSIVKYGRPVS